MVNLKPIARGQSILAIVAYAALRRIKYQSTNKGKSCNRFRFLLNCPQLLLGKKTHNEKHSSPNVPRQNMPFKLSLAICICQHGHNLQALQKNHYVVTALCGHLHFAAWL